MPLVFSCELEGRVHRGIVHVTVREGKKHEVRKMFAAIGVPVERLCRIRMGGLLLPGDLPMGAGRPIAPVDVERAFGASGSSLPETVAPGAA